MGFWTGAKALLGFDGVANSAMKIVDRIAGTDWTPEQKADYTLKYMAATKHQSPARRLIAFGILGEHLVLAGAWLVFICIGNQAQADAVHEFLKSNINLSLEIILAFYFLSGMVKKA